MRRVALIEVHNERPRCEDQRLIDAKFGLVMNVEMHGDRFSDRHLDRHGPV
jgi:hypothetical protein